MRKKCSRKAGMVLMSLMIAISVGGPRGAAGTAGSIDRGEMSAGDSSGQESRPNGMSSMFKGTVSDVIDAGRYFYIQVNTGDKQVWVAVPTFDGGVGDEVLVPPGVPVADFQSKKLDRKFDMIYFVGDIRRLGESDTETPAGDLPKNRIMHPPMDELAEMPVIEIGKVVKAEDGYTVSEILTNGKNLAGTQVRLRARVVKVTTNIMGKNWIHVQDGSGRGGANDLIVTTKALVKTGDLVMISGKVSVDRDFGFGFKYNVMIEDAEVSVE